MSVRRAPPTHKGSAAWNHRNSFQLLTTLNEKTPKGEKAGLLTATLYLAPHTIGGPKSLCPHSTEACRAGCLYHAGRGTAGRVVRARGYRTSLYWEERAEFMLQLCEDLEKRGDVAAREGLTGAIRLNGTSDIRWELERVAGMSLFEYFADLRFYDYTRIPPHHRRVPDGWHLTFSLADDPLEVALAHLQAGRNVAVVVPEEEKLPHGSWSILAGQEVTWVDGDEHDARFLDPSPAIVQLRPKGRVHPAMMRHNLPAELRRASKEFA